MSDDQRARREGMTERELLLEMLATQDDLKATTEGLKVTVSHWAGETLNLHERYRETLDEISRLGRRVGGVERKQSESSMQAVTLPAPAPSDGNGAPSQ